MSDFGMTPLLSDIRYITERACCSAKRMRNSRFKDQAVNWADFGPTEVSYKIVVICEEASPDASKVCAYIQEKLAAAGFSEEEVEVILEW